MRDNSGRAARTRVTPSSHGSFLQKGGDPAPRSRRATLLRLSASHQAYLRRLPPLRVGTPTSGAPSFHRLTGGVYKARERIHGGVLIRRY